MKSVANTGETCNPMTRLVDQVREAFSTLSECATPPALIGGLALAAHQVVRATRDLELLADAADADRIDRLLTAIGYRCVHRSLDVANYVRADEGLDVLFAHRPAALRLLRTATERSTAMGKFKVVSAEGLIGFKLQAIINDPTRSQDVGDIRALLRTQRDRLDMAEVSAYFSLFDRSDFLAELMTEISNESH